MKFSLIEIPFKKPINLLGNRLSIKKHLFLKTEDRICEVSQLPGLSKFDFTNSGKLTKNDRNIIDNFWIPYLTNLPENPGIIKTKINHLFFPDSQSVEDLKLSEKNVEFSLKVKCGRLGLEEDCKVLSQLIRKFPKIKLRLDSNQNWSLRDCLIIFDKFMYNIEYFEEPFKNLEEYEKGRVLPFAADLILQQFPYSDLKELFSTFILKPGLWSSFSHFDKLVLDLKQDKKNIIISSLFESSIGLGGLAMLANKYNLKSAHGLGTLNYLNDPFRKNFVEEKDSEIVFDFNKLDMSELSWQSL